LVETGVQRPVLGEELQDLLGCSPAGGTVVCRGYIDAHEEIIKFHKLVKEKLFKGLISTIASYASIELSADGPTTENDVSSALEDSLDNLVIIQDRDRFFKHLTKRCNQRIPVEREKLLLKNSSKPQPQELRELDKATRWGADDIDLLFDGILKLKSHPEFNTRTPDIRRIGNFWPFKKAHTLNTVCAMTEVEWAKYSLNDIQRSILLIDQLQQQFSPITAELIPQLAPHAVRTLMSSKRITDPVDQLRELQQTLEEQIRTGSITPLVNL
jgi:hypothetical protein